MRTQTLFAFTALVLASCGNDAILDHDSNTSTDAPFTPITDEPVETEGTLISRTFTESTRSVLNPERGFYTGYDLLRPERAAAVRAHGYTLALAKVRLDAYRDSDLDAAFLATLGRGFDAARAAGIKVVLRFAYNSSEAADAPRARMLGHIAQLQPLLTAHADVISVLQAGFIGQWGEWHDSSNGLDNDVDRAAILDALLHALPPSRMVQVRAPLFKAGPYPGGALSDSEGFGTSSRARVGHHNDCFLASNSDYGTYASPVDTWKAYVAQDTRYTPMGGETCVVNAPRTSCAAAMTELEMLHWSYLNRDYNTSVLDSWSSGGCMTDVEQRLGYRLALGRVDHTAAVAPGGVLNLVIAINNRGFAALFNQRPVEIVLASDTTRRVVRLTDVDARRWAPGTETTLRLRLRIPADAAPGSYRLAMRLPDAAPALEDDPRYAIRLANDDLWDDDTADNLLTDALLIDGAAPGPRDPAATAFTQLP